MQVDMTMLRWVLPSATNDPEPLVSLLDEAFISCQVHAACPCPSRSHAALAPPLPEPTNTDHHPRPSPLAAAVFARALLEAPAVRQPPPHPFASRAVRSALSNACP